MEIGNNEGNTNTQTRDNAEKLVYYIDPPGDRNRDLRDGDIMKTGGQTTQLRRSLKVLFPI